jgi:hypothetical protein
VARKVCQKGFSGLIPKLLISVAQRPSLLVRQKHTVSDLHWECIKGYSEELSASY